METPARNPNTEPRADAEPTASEKSFAEYKRKLAKAVRIDTQMQHSLALDLHNLGSLVLELQRLGITNPIANLQNAGVKMSQTELRHAADVAGSFDSYEVTQLISRGVTCRPIVQLADSRFDPWRQTLIRLVVEGDITPRGLGRLIRAMKSPGGAVVRETPRGLGRLIRATKSPGGALVPENGSRAAPRLTL